MTMMANMLSHFFLVFLAFPFVLCEFEQSNPELDAWFHWMNFTFASKGEYEEYVVKEYYKNVMPAGIKVLFYFLFTKKIMLMFSIS